MNNTQQNLEWLELPITLPNISTLLSYSVFNSAFISIVETTSNGVRQIESSYWVGQSLNPQTDLSPTNLGKMYVIRWVYMIVGYVGLNFQIHKGCNGWIWIQIFRSLQSDMSELVRLSPFHMALAQTQKQAI